MLAWGSFGLAIAALAFGVRRLAFGYPESRGRFDHLTRAESCFLDAAAEVMFPVGGAIPLSGIEANLPRYLDRYFATLFSRKKAQIRMLFVLFEQATIIFPAPGRLGWRRFSSLDLDQRVAVFHAWRGSRWFLRRVVFMALRSMLTMGYIGHPAALRYLHLAPFEIKSPICEADLLYPRIGELPETNPLGESDLSPRSDGTPLDINGPLHPDYEEKPL
ncbi:MAG: hypothetical protein V3T33_01085 [Myxococcota bacterium]